MSDRDVLGWVEVMHRKQHPEEEPKLPPDPEEVAAMLAALRVLAEAIYIHHHQCVVLNPSGTAMDNQLFAALARATALLWGDARAGEPEACGECGGTGRTSKQLVPGMAAVVDCPSCQPPRREREP